MARPLSCHFLGQLTKEPLDGLEFVNMEMNRTHNFEAFESSSSTSSFNSIPPLGLSSQMEIEMSSVDSNIHDWFLLEIVELTYFYYLLLYFY